MKKLVLLTFIVLGLSFFAQAQKDTSYWTKGGMIGINGTQTGFKNWAQGGQNTIAATGTILLQARYKKGKNAWDNMLLWNLGASKVGTDFTKKSDDQLEFNSKYGHQASEHWYYSALFNFKTQSIIGYEYPTDSTQVKFSGFLAPAYIKLGLGMDYKPNDFISVYISPATVRWLIVNDDNLANAGAFGVDKAVYDTLGNMISAGQKVQTQFGAYLRFVFEKEVIKNVTVGSIFELYSDYLKEPQNIDINWQLLITMKVNEFMNAQIKTNLIYDHDIPVGIDDTGDGKFDRFGPRTQFNEQISIGLMYKFGKVEE
jgi:hypothetical protein